ncbi:MAG: efflux RND transporter periplasmic adaptor subunit [Chloroflexi bacterium]|nr:efflux RND transporter periplasmic adaptor subunit [Chloroflexota bacterium]MBI3732528.1 efflux RND transporter periplasmic adaptor subunit [Chloroflexota bacterium]
MTKYVKLLLLFVTLVPLGVVGYFVAPVARATPSAPAYKLVAVKQGAIVSKVTAPGSISFSLSASITARTTGVLQQLKVTIGDKVKAGQVIAQLDTSALSGTVTQLQYNLAQAEAKLALAQKPYSDEDIAQARAAVRSAEVGAQNAEQNLQVAQLMATITPQDIENMWFQAQWYQNYYTTTLAALIADGKSEKEIAAHKDLQAGYNQWQMYQKAYEDKGIGIIKQEVTLRSVRNAVDQAQESLRLARNKLATVLAGANSADVQLSQRAVEAAQAALEAALAQQKAATIVAPFDGTVISVPTLGPGDSVSGSTVMATIADLTKMQVDALVNEIDVGKIAPRQAAKIRVDAFAGKMFTGAIVRIATTATVQQGVTAYATTVLIDKSDELLKQGMTASIEVVVGQRENVLVVLNEALQSGPGTSKSVKVPDSAGGFTTRAVTVGLSDDKNTEIVEGLQAGEQVAIVTVAATNDTKAKQPQPPGPQPGK